MTDKERTPLKIAIVGTAPSSMHDAPYQDESWQIWGLSTSPDEMPRWDRWTELHDLKRKRAVHPQYYRFLTEVKGKTIYLDQLDPNIPLGVEFPKDQVVERFSPLFTNTPDGFAYFTNTVSWLLALAIIEIEANGGIGEIGVWGVDMAVGSIVSANQSEYAHQRPSCEWFLGYAAALFGKPVQLPKTSNLCTARHMYGFDTDNSPMYFQIHSRRDELTARRAQIIRDLAETETMAAKLEGGVIELTKMLQGFNGEAPAELTQRCTDLTAHHANALRGVEELKEGRAVITGALTDLDWTTQGCPPGEGVQ